MTDAVPDAASRREQRRRRHQHFSREQFLDAAEETFGRKGYFETTLREVADLADYSVGSVYSFFASKEDLFRHLFLRRGEQFMPELRDLLGSADTEPVRQLHALVDFEIGWFRRHPHFGRLYLRHSSANLLPTGEAKDEVMVANHHEAMALQADLFRRGQEAGVIRAGDPLVLARMFSGVMSTFQSLDPAVMSDAPDAVEPFALAELHDLVEAMFVVGTSGRG